MAHTCPVPIYLSLILVLLSVKLLSRVFRMKMATLRLMQPWLCGSNLVGMA